MPQRTGPKPRIRQQHQLLAQNVEHSEVLQDAYAPDESNETFAELAWEHIEWPDGGTPLLRRAPRGDMSGARSRARQGYIVTVKGPPDSAQLLRARLVDSEFEVASVRLAGTDRRKLLEIDATLEHILTPVQAANQQLPKTAPALYKGKIVDGDPLEFVRTHYRLWIEARTLTLSYLGKLDKKLKSAIQHERDRGGRRDEVRAIFVKPAELPADSPLTTLRRKFWREDQQAHRAQKKSNG